MESEDLKQRLETFSEWKPHERQQDFLQVPYDGLTPAWSVINGLTDFSAWGTTFSSPELVFLLQNGVYRFISLITNGELYMGKDGYHLPATITTEIIEAGVPVQVEEARDEYGNIIKYWVYLQMRTANLYPFLIDGKHGFIRSIYGNYFIRKNLMYPGNQDWYNGKYSKDLNDGYIDAINR